MKHIYHHITDPENMVIESDSIYHQYGSIIGRVIFTSLNRIVTVVGENVEIDGGLFTTDRDSACMEITRSAKNYWVTNSMLIGGSVGCLMS